MSIFATTRWSLILQPVGDARARPALEELCRIYRPAVLAFVRARGHAPQDAEDLAQGFFEHFVGQKVYASADPGRGRFRTFLRAAITNYLHNAHDHAVAAKRGGGTEIGSLDDEPDGSALADPSARADPERAFDLSFAVTVLDRALHRLRDEVRSTGRTRQFELMQPFLAERPESREYGQIADELGISPNAVAAAVRRLRQRMAALVRAELADTVEGDADLAAELEALDRLRAPDAMR